MYKEFSIRNFRGFKVLHIHDFGLVNLIAGRNDVGKTAVLEAMFLHSGPQNPSLPTTIENLRGRYRFALNPKAIWGWLFPGRDTDETIELAGTGDCGGMHTLQVRLSRQTPSVTLPFPDTEVGGSAADAPLIRDLELEYSGPEGDSHVSRAYVRDGKLKADQPGPAPGYPCTYLTSRSRVDSETAERYTRVNDAGRIDVVVDTARHLDDRVRRVLLGYENDQPVIKCDIGLAEAVPVQLIGEGINRLIQISLAVADAENGVVLIDEFENGLHYASLPDIWRSLGAVSRQENVQIVATTHSLECIRAAFSAFQESNENDLAVYRLDRIKGETHMARYDLSEMAVLLEMDMEMRGH